MRQNFKFRPREEVLYFWPAKNNYYRAVVLKQQSYYQDNPDQSHYQIRILNYQDGNWTMTAVESSLSKIENPNKLMKELINV